VTYEERALLSAVDTASPLTNDIPANAEDRNAAAFQGAATCRHFCIHFCTGDIEQCNEKDDVKQILRARNRALGALIALDARARHANVTVQELLANESRSKRRTQC
jgi:hypothetical protein